MSSVIDSLERAQLRRVPPFRAGDRVRVHFQVVEGTRRRTQVFEGIVIKRQGVGVRETFTVRKQSFGVGVERTFPVHSPKIERVEIAARGDVRRARLYYLRDRVGRAARVRERRYTAEEQAADMGAMPTDADAVRPGEEALAEQVEAEAAERAAAERADADEAAGEQADAREAAERADSGEAAGEQANPAQHADAERAATGSEPAGSEPSAAGAGGEDEGAAEPGGRGAEDAQADAASQAPRENG